MTSAMITQNTDRRQRRNPIRICGAIEDYVYAQGKSNWPLPFARLEAQELIGEQPEVG
jgi:hypothetical protein